MLGAGAGPFHVVGQNSEMMPNLSFSSESQNPEIKNLSRIAKIDREGKCIVSPVPEHSTDFALMANLFCCNGDEGEVLKITASHRIGKLNFTAAIQEVLKDRYEETVSLGGVFLIKRGKVMLHVMPDFCAERLEHDMMREWLRFFEVSAEEVGGLVCLSTLHSRKVEGLGLRMEHTHCFSGDGTMGGHYHFDTTAEEVEYEAYFNTAKVIYRIDQPPSQE